MKMKMTDEELYNKIKEDFRNVNEALLALKQEVRKQNEELYDSINKVKDVFAVMMQKLIFAAFKENTNETA